MAIDGRPLVATARRLLEHRAEALWAGAEAARRNHGAERIVCAVDEGVAVLAPAGVTVVPLPDVVRSGDPREILGDVGVVDGIVVQAADLVEQAGGGRYVTIAGAVTHPAVVPVRAGAAVADVVETSLLAWIALRGGPLGREALAPPETIPVTDGLYVTPPGSDLARRARREVRSLVREALSACDGCRACTDVCPPHHLGSDLAPDRIVRALAHDIAPPGGTAACVGCGICDLACPSGLLPGRLVYSLPRLSAEARPPAPLRRMAMSLALSRLGLSAETPAPRWGGSP